MLRTTDFKLLDLLYGSGCITLKEEILADLAKIRQIRFPSKFLFLSSAKLNSRQIYKTKEKNMLEPKKILKTLKLPLKTRLKIFNLQIKFQPKFLPLR